MTIALEKINGEVFMAVDRIVRLGPEYVSFLKVQAAGSPRRRARICAHRHSGDSLHEMLIVVAADSYIRPHKHPNKIESFHVVEGSVDVVVLDDGGAIVELVELGDASSGKAFFYRLADSLYHTLLIHSAFLVMHEVTNGPFVADETVLAPFAPPEGQRIEALAYVAELRRQAATLRISSLETHTP